jgi:succinoglycan biosynthesis protein ExoA
MKPFLSVIIPCRNESRFLPQCLASVLASDYPADRMEILISDGASEDGTREFIEALIAQRSANHDARIRLIDNPLRITPVGLNRAIDAAQGDVIARVDAHATVSPEYFSTCVEFLESCRADCVGGSMRTVPQEQGWFSQAIVAVLTHRFGVGNSFFRIGAAEPRQVDTVFGACWRRDVFDRVGRFHPQLARSQDMEFSLRLKAAGGKTWMVPSVETTYYARTKLGRFARHNFTNGMWAVLPFVYSDVVPVSVRHMIPLAFVLALFAGALALPWTPMLLASVAGPYVLANLTASVSLVYRERKPSLLRAPFIFFLLHASYGLGSIVGAVRACRILRLPVLRSKEKSCIPQL